MKELTCPPGGSVDWTFRHDATGSKTVVNAKTWFAARQEASIKLGASPEALTCVVNGATGQLVADTDDSVTASGPTRSFERSTNKDAETERAAKS